MTDAVPELVFSDEDAHPVHRTPPPSAPVTVKRSPLDPYILTAIVSAGTVLDDRRFPRRITEV